MVIGFPYKLTPTIKNLKLSIQFFTGLSFLLTSELQLCIKEFINLEFSYFYAFVNLQLMIKLVIWCQTEKNVKACSMIFQVHGRLGNKH